MKNSAESTKKQVKTPAKKIELKMRKLEKIETTGLRETGG